MTLSSQPCRSRKVKCTSRRTDEGLDLQSLTDTGDGRRPVCLRCQQGSRECYWNYNAQNNQSPALPRAPPIIQRPEENKYISTKDPEIALQDPRVARLFRYYIDHLASWYDLNDSKRHFEDIVPACARRNSLLLSAILAFSAASQSSSVSDDSLWELADSYHLESVQRLLSLTEDLDEFRTGETLAAICLLRSYEIISRSYSRSSFIWLLH